MELNPELVAALGRLAAGKTEPAEWTAWWDANAAWVVKLLNPGQLLRLKPRGDDLFAAALGSQREAFQLLDKWGVPHERSDRYQIGWQQSLAEFCSQADAERSRREKEFLPLLTAIAADFPKFARFLKKRTRIIDRIGGPASSEELDNAERAMGAVLPPAYRQFLRHARDIELGDTLKFGLTFTFIHKAPRGVGWPSDGMLCFGECWLEADGDQVLFGRTEATNREPPVLYYAHEAAPPKVRPMAAEFRTWLEGISKWKAFRE